LLANAAPHLYVTFHSESNVYRLSTKNTVPGKRDLIPVINNGTDDLRGLRSMVLSRDGRLFVANSYTEDSKVIECSQAYTDHTRDYTGDLTVYNKQDNPLLDHPYGLAVSNDNTMMYVSSQNSNAVTRYFLTDGTPVPNPLPLRSKPKGTFVALPDNGSGEDQGLRAVTFDDAGLLYVAHRDMNVILTYDPSGNLVGKQTIVEPIGLFYQSNFSNGQAALFASTKSGSVYSYYVKEEQLQPLSQFDGIGHGTGLAVINSTLYVLDQDGHCMHTFNVFSGNQIDTITLPYKDPEQVIIAP